MARLSHFVLKGQLAHPQGRTGGMNGRFSPSLRGAQAEAAVAEYLTASGYVVVATNLRLGHYELDVVARRGDLIVVVEVRFRGHGAWTTGFGSILPEKRKHVRRAAESLWRKRYLRDDSVSRLRIDAAAVFIRDGKYVIDYCPAAF